MAGNWHEVLDARREENGDEEYELLFHFETPAGHILFGPDQADETSCEIGAHPDQWISVTLEQVDEQLTALGLPLDGWN